MRMIGCDFHAAQQTIAMLDRETGEIVERKLTHDGTTVRDFYAGLPPPVVEAPEPAMRADGAAQPFAAFYPLCASCHATAERFPPNFLAGSPDRVAASVKHCAPRIYARLALWQVAPAAREKSPMPPPIAAPRREAYEAPASLGGLERAAAELVRAESGAAPRLATMLADGYESLRPCLP